MTIPEFLDLLKKYKRRWTLIEGVISSEYYCVITWICYQETGKEFEIDEALIAGYHLGLSKLDILTIVDSADNNTDFKLNKLLRRKLLEVTDPVVL